MPRIFSRCSRMRAALVAALAVLLVPAVGHAAPVRVVTTAMYSSIGDVVAPGGPVDGTVTILLADAFNALSPAELRASYDVLFLSQFAQADIDVAWTTRLQPFLALGGGVVFESVNNAFELAPAVTKNAEYIDGGNVLVTADVPVLTTGVRSDPGGFNWPQFTFTAWDPALSPFLTFAGSVTGLYGTLPGGGRLVVTGVGQDGYTWFGDAITANHRRLLIGELRWVARVCEAGDDADGDGVVNQCDVCPQQANPGQEDLDQDLVGDACDACPGDGSTTDDDDDGRCGDPGVCPAGCDNCPFASNAAQADADGDGRGDACDGCALPNRFDQDRDYDGIDDVCDPCVTTCSFPQCATECRDRESGECTVTPRPDGTRCSDFDRCTEGDSCSGGVCVTTPVVCPPSADACAESLCVSWAGCTTIPQQNGAACDDGDRCTSGDRCTLGACSGTPVDACRADPMQCYAASGSSRARLRFELSDRFGTRPMDLEKTSAACHPARPDEETLLDGARHLVCSRLQAPEGIRFANRTIAVSDRFGSSELRLVRPISYCAPAAEPGVPASLQLDELACYRVRGGAAADRVVELTDAVETRSRRVLRPYSFCVPASRDGAAVADPARNLTCYEVRNARRGATPRHEVALVSALGEERLRTRRVRTLCVPSAVEPCARATFASSGSSYTGSSFCGGTLFDPPPEPPFIGALHDAASGGSRLHDLAAGCTYFGGGANDVYPASPTLAGGRYELAATSCAAPELPMVAAGEVGDAGCARGPADFRICLTAFGRRCTSDAQCPGSAPGRCSPAPRCFSGPPQPFRTAVANVCLLTPLDSDVQALLAPDTGDLQLTTSSRTLVYAPFGGLEPDPCPRCVAGTCTDGARRGLACAESTSPEQTSLDCPPYASDFFLSVASEPAVLSTDSVSLSAADGLFCPGQRNPGAFGDPAVRRIELTRGPIVSLRDGEPHATALLQIGCLPATGNPVADDLSDFPGPQAMSVAGAVQFSE